MFQSRIGVGVKMAVRPHILIVLLVGAMIVLPACAGPRAATPEPTLSAPTLDSSAPAPTFTATVFVETRTSPAAPAPTDDRGTSVGVRDATASSTRPAPTLTPTLTVAATASATPRPTPTPTAGGEVVCGGLDAFPSLDPLSLMPSPVPSLLGLIWESLLAVDSTDGSLLPALARTWEVSGDGLSIEFVLREGIAWSDGRPLVAQDVVSTFDRIRDPEARSPWQFNLTDVKDYAAPDDRRVRVTLSEAGCAALYDLGSIPILPAHALDSAPDSGEPPIFVGTGPFRLVGRRADGALVLERNRSYRDPVTLDKIIYVTFGSTDDLLNAWQAGRLGVAALPPLSAGQAPAALLEGALTYPDQDALLIVFNTAYSPLNDRGVRQALSLALDRGAIARQSSVAGGTLLATSLLPSHWAVTPKTAAADLAVPTYDQAEADRLLVEAGWTDDDGDGVRTKGWRRLTLNVLTNGDNQMRSNVAALIAQSYRQIGVDSEVHRVEWGILLDALFRHDYELAVISWPFPLDVDQQLFWHSSQTDSGSGFNFSGWQDESADAWLDALVSTSGCDEERRAALFVALARRLAEERPVDFLFAPHRSVLVRPALSGLEPSPYAGLFWNAPVWRWSAPGP